mgnify:CR=1 FL=1
MIARIWRGLTANDQADEYLAYRRLTGLKEYRETPGNRGVFVLRRTQGGRGGGVLGPVGGSRDAAGRCAGSSPETAKSSPEDRRFLLEMEPNVRHYEVTDALGLPELLAP